MSEENNEMTDERLRSQGDSSVSDKNEQAAQESETPQETDDNVSGDSGPGDGDELAVLRRRIAELEEENSELKDRYLRKQADFENYRKRAIREREELSVQANRQLLLDIVLIIDDFERAIKSVEESRDFDAFHGGVVLIEKQFTSMLERKWSLSRFDDAGEEFDPQKHEAVASEPAPGEDTARVLEVYQNGYMLGDKVLRSAKVKVSLPQNDNS